MEIRIVALYRMIVAKLSHFVALDMQHAAYRQVILSWRHHMP